mmetsp:Transcript_24015/g.50342  ORF Transcript_24015/g.50342 Transcript_24015/m.50342 type:complete len:225 (+) Transcript_24015:1276-1950(+)
MRRILTGNWKRRDGGSEIHPPSRIRSGVRRTHRGAHEERGNQIQRGIGADQTRQIGKRRWVKRENSSHLLQWRRRRVRYRPHRHRSDRGYVPIGSRKCQHRGQSPKLQNPRQLRTDLRAQHLRHRGCHGRMPRIDTRRHSRWKSAVSSPLWRIDSSHGLPQRLHHRLHSFGIRNGGIFGGRCPRRIWRGEYPSLPQILYSFGVESLPIEGRTPGIHQSDCPQTV